MLKAMEKIRAERPSESRVKMRERIHLKNDDDNVKHFLKNFKRRDEISIFKQEFPNFLKILMLDKILQSNKFHARYSEY